MADREAIEAFTGRFEPYSDFSFSLLTFYNCGEPTHWCWLNGNFVLRFRDSFGPGIFLTFLGNQRAAATAVTLIDYATEMGFTATLWRIPEMTAKAIADETDGFTIEEDRDGFDYVYSVDSTARLEGSTYSALRQDLNRFKRRTSSHRFVRLDLQDAATQRQLQSVMSLWQSHKAGKITVNNYTSAVDQCLRHAGCFDLIGLGIIVGDSLIGYNVAEQIGAGWLLSHFAAADPRFSGLSGSLLHRLACTAAELGCAHVNYQEDVGDPGLRHFKMKCAPKKFFRKFAVRRTTRAPSREGEAPSEPKYIVGSHGGSPSQHGGSPSHKKPCFS